MEAPVHTDLQPMEVTTWLAGSCLQGSLLPSPLGTLLDTNGLYDEDVCTPDNLQK